MDSLPLFARGKSMLSDALSPTTQRRFAGFLEVTTPSGTDNSGSPNGNSPVQQTPSPARRTPRIRRSSAYSEADFELFSDSSKSLVRIQCNARPFLIQLAMERGRVVLNKFERRSDGKREERGDVERSGLVQPGDLLMGVDDDIGVFRSLEEAQETMKRAELPAMLTFRRVVTVKEALGGYTEQHIARYLVLRDSVLTRVRSLNEASLLVKACIEACGESQSTVPLQDYIAHVEQVVLPSLGILCDGRTTDKKQRFEQIKQVMETIHQRVDARKKQQIKAWNAAKSSNYRRIEILARQRSSIKDRLDKMRENRSDLQPENHALWTEYIELRHLHTQLSENVEKSKQEHYLPDFEGYSLRFGSDGIYIGVGDIWIPSFHAKFTIETRSTAPHLFLHISTPSTHGLKLRVVNFTLATEGRLPSFHCDELNIEAQLVADIPLVFDSISGWTVPQDELDVKLMSLVYYERQANSTKRGKDHDTIMKMFINRMLPSVVRQAAQRLFCVELGPLIQNRDAQVVVSGDIKISGRKLSVYDAALNSAVAGAKGAKDLELSDMAREVMALSDDEVDALYTVFKTFMDTHNNNKTLFSKVETPRMCIRNLITYFDQFNQAPHLKVLACELWGQSMHLVSPNYTESPSQSQPDSSPFAPIINTIEQIKEYPVDVSISLIDVTFRLNLCEAAATYYMALQRIIRRSMDTSSVGLANLAELRDGTYLENKLKRLDARYEKMTWLLSHLTSNVDVLGVICRGVLPSGFMSKLFVEAREFTCKGPCTGSITVPLSDVSALTSPNGVEIPTQTVDEGDTSVMTRTHENGALVLSKFMAEAFQTSSIDGDTGLPSDRLKVAVQNPSIRVLLEVPTDISQLEPGQTLVPFALSMVTDSPSEPPKLKVETGDFGKCQYSVDRVTMSGSVWQYVKQAQESTEGLPNMATPTTEQSDMTDGSIWDEYLESPFFSLKFHFFTSCQVTRDSIFLSIGSASLTESKVAQLKHRLCLGQLLQDFDMISVVDPKASRRKAGAKFQHALHHRSADAELHGPPSISNYSRRQTIFSPTSVAESTDDLDAWSGPNSYQVQQSFEGAGSESSSADSLDDQLPPPIRVAVTGDGSGRRQSSAVFF